MLIVFAGPACSGKSTLAAELAQHHGWPHLSMDRTRQRLLPDAAHTRADREVAYRAMHWAGELLVAAGASAILDAPYGHPEDRAEVQRIAGKHMKLIECRVSIAAALERLRQRGIPDPTRPDLTEERAAQLNREYRYSGEGLLLDTDQLSEAECLAQIEEFVGR